jgi:hypothetical protein
VSYVFVKVLVPLDPFVIAAQAVIAVGVNTALMQGSFK